MTLNDTYNKKLQNMKSIKLVRLLISLAAVIFVIVAIVGNMGSNGWHTLYATASTPLHIIFQTTPSAPAQTSDTKSQDQELAVLLSNTSTSTPTTATGFTPLSSRSQGIGQTPPEYTEINGSLGDGDTLALSLIRQKVPAKVRGLIINNLSTKLDLRRLKPSDQYTITLDQQGNLKSCVYNSGPLERYTITAAHNNSYRTTKEAVQLEVKTVHISGQITSSLFASFAKKHEDFRLIYAFADIFASRIDFNTETHLGDTYSMVFDKYYKAGTLAGYGKIKAASYIGQRVSLSAYHYVSGANISGYFDKEGQEIGTLFIRSPLPMGRLTSKFSYHRRHPITGKIQPHLGIDLAAPTGTPIMAAGDGRIISLGRNAGNGKQIIIAHNSGYKTYYGHMSNYKKGLRKGSLVHKKDIIGYVGATGIATGPHLDYRINHNGVFKDPFAITFEPKSTIAKRDIPYFKQQVRQLAKIIKDNIGIEGQEIIQASTFTLSPDHNNISLL